MPKQSYRPHESKRRFTETAQDTAIEIPSVSPEPNVSFSPNHVPRVPRPRWTRSIMPEKRRFTNNGPVGRRLNSIVNEKATHTNAKATRVLRREKRMLRDKAIYPLHFLNTASTVTSADLSHRPAISVMSVYEPARNRGSPSTWTRRCSGLGRRRRWPSLRWGCNWVGCWVPRRRRPSRRPALSDCPWACSPGRRTSTRCSGTSARCRLCPSPGK